MLTSKQGARCRSLFGVGAQSVGYSAEVCSRSQRIPHLTRQLASRVGLVRPEGRRGNIALPACYRLRSSPPDRTHGRMVGLLAEALGVAFLPAFLVVAGPRSAIRCVSSLSGRSGRPRRNSRPSSLRHSRPRSRACPAARRARSPPPPRRSSTLQRGAAAPAIPPAGQPCAPTFRGRRCRRALLRIRGGDQRWPIIGWFSSD